MKVWHLFILVPAACFVFGFAVEAKPEPAQTPQVTLDEVIEEDISAGDVPVTDEASSEEEESLGPLVTAEGSEYGDELIIVGELPEPEPVIVREPTFQERFEERKYLILMMVLLGLAAIVWILGLWRTPKVKRKSY